MVIYPLQYFGIGDIIFTQTLVRKIADGNPIVWGVLPQFIEGLQRAYPDIAWIDYRKTGLDYNCREDKIIGDKRIVPIRWNVEILKVPYTQCMSSKYELYGLDWRTWKEAAMWKGSFEMEFALMHNRLHDKIDKHTPFIYAEYNVVNRTFGSNNQFHVHIDVNNGLPNIEMQPIPAYSLFDWALLLQGANEIHTVSTSIIYLLELLDLPKKPDIHIYLRSPQETNHKNYEYLLQSHNYILH